MSIKNPILKTVSILLLIVFTFILVGIIYMLSVRILSKTLKPEDTENEQKAISIVQNWRIPDTVDLTCKGWIEVLALPYQRFGDAEIDWSSTKMDDEGNYEVKVSIHNPGSNVIFRWKVNILSNSIFPLDNETICPPPD